MSSIISESPAEDVSISLSSAMSDNSLGRSASEASSDSSSRGGCRYVTDITQVVNNTTKDSRAIDMQTNCYILKITDKTSKKKFTFTNVKYIM